MGDRDFLHSATIRAAGPDMFNVVSPKIDPPTPCLMYSILNLFAWLRLYMSFCAAERFAHRSPNTRYLAGIIGSTSEDVPSSRVRALPYRPGPTYLPDHSIPCKLRHQHIILGWCPLIVDWQSLLRSNRRNDRKSSIIHWHSLTLTQ